MLLDHMCEKNFKDSFLGIKYFHYKRSPNVGPIVETEDLNKNIKVWMTFFNLHLFEHAIYQFRGQ